MKFSLAIEKKNNKNIGTVEGHNTRAHLTASQLPAAAWITPEGRHQIVKFNSKLLAQAKSLAKRKDAVLAIELVIQVGNQTDWRELPTDQFPFGRRKTGASARLNALITGVQKAAFAEFGKERIVSIELHSDESTPHAHIVFVPIFEGKLQAKRWLDGATSCAALRERLHGHVTQHIPCSYQKGAPGGAPHDPSKAAGGAMAPSPAPSFFAKTADRFSGASTIKQLQAVSESQNLKIQTMFSRLKKAEALASSESQGKRFAEERTRAVERDARRMVLELKDRIAQLGRQIAELTPAVIRAVTPNAASDPVTGVVAASKAHYR